MEPGFSDRIDKIVLQNYKKAACGLTLAIVHDKKTIYQKSFGSIEKLNFKYTDKTIYDLASLTKSLITTTLIGKLLEKGEISLDDDLKTIGFIKNSNIDNVTIKSLISHSTGFVSSYPLYNIGKNKKSYIKAIDLLYNGEIYKKEVYSDLNFILLGFIIEYFYNDTLDNVARKEILDPLSLKNTSYNPEYNDLIAPTEVTTRGLLRGKVHDENAYYLGGVSGHAGLFSDINDLIIFMNKFLNGEILTSKTVDLFTTLQNKYLNGTFGYGWMVKTKRPENPSEAFGYSAFMGDYLPYGSFGHTGFTGTSIVVNKNNNTFSILLTNRVYPSRDNTNILKFRRILNNAIFMDL